VVLAPWAGTVTGVLAHEGDTVIAGSILVTLGDLSRLQVETTDVDEFLVGRITRGTAVRLTVDAIDGSQMHGVVRAVAVEPQTTASGDRHYPATIDLVDPPANLRPGMTVRLYLGS
jgi:multidrug resistance efflux pump